MLGTLHAAFTADISSIGTVQRMGVKDQHNLYLDTGVY